MDLLFLDTETTGIDPSTDRLCQICFKVEDTIFFEYFKPPVPISIKSSSITHITNKMVQDKPVFLDHELHKTLQDFLQTHILVAHNARFDIAILKNEGIKVPKFICTLKVVRFLDQKNLVPEYNLQFLRYFYELEVDARAHDATGDVLVLEAIFNQLYEQMFLIYGDREAVLNKMIEISNQPTIFNKMPFGKHKDKSLTEVVQQDKEYLLWLLNDKITKQPDDEDWIFTLQYHLSLKPED